MWMPQSYFPYKQSKIDSGDSKVLGPSSTPYLSSTKICLLIQIPLTPPSLCRSTLLASLHKPLHKLQHAWWKLHPTVHWWKHRRHYSLLWRLQTGHSQGHHIHRPYWPRYHPTRWSMEDADTYLSPWWSWWSAQKLPLWLQRLSSYMDQIQTPFLKFFAWIIFEQHWVPGHPEFW